MRGGWNPTRRSKKIGTPDRAWRDQVGTTPRFDVPWPMWDDRAPAERWSPVAVEDRVVHGRPLRVVLDALRDGCVHPCSVQDVCDVLSRLPSDDVRGIELVVLRQPSRKEEIHRPAWGSIRWSSNFRGYSDPVILLDSIDPTRRLRWKRSLWPEGQRELAAVRETGFRIDETRREYLIALDPEPVRRWQMTQTLPHEVGHYVDWYHRAGYWERPTREREEFATHYAKQCLRQLADLFPGSTAPKAPPNRY